MSCGNPHETDCSEVLDHLYEYLDHEMSDGRLHQVQGALRASALPAWRSTAWSRPSRSWSSAAAGRTTSPADLRSKVLTRIEMIRAGEVAPLDADAARSEPA